MDIAFLMDPEDTIAHYMMVGKQRAEEMESKRDSALSTALSEMPHETAVNVARGAFSYVICLPFKFYALSKLVYRGYNDGLDFVVTTNICNFVQ